jgi:GNAT superfamily N-acetyltransferase
VAKTFAGHASPLSARGRIWIVETASGHGLGKRLVVEALAFCRECAYAAVILSTEGPLTAAKRSAVWGAVRTEERHELRLS